MACFRINSESLEVSRDLGRHLRALNCISNPPRRVRTYTGIYPPPPLHLLPQRQITCHHPSCREIPWHPSQQESWQGSQCDADPPRQRKICVNSGDIPAIFSRALLQLCRKPFISRVYMRPSRYDERGGRHGRGYWSNASPAGIKLPLHSCPGLHYA